MSIAKDIAGMVHEAIDGGVKAAEDIHRSIVDLQMKTLDDVTGLDEPLQKVREVRERTIGALYGTIRDVNARIGRFTSELLT